MESAEGAAAGVVDWGATAAAEEDGAVEVLEVLAAAVSAALVELELELEGEAPGAASVEVDEEGAEAAVELVVVTVELDAAWDEEDDAAELDELPGTGGELVSMRILLGRATDEVGDEMMVASVVPFDTIGAMPEAGRALGKDPGAQRHWQLQSPFGRRVPTPPTIAPDEPTG